MCVCTVIQPASPKKEMMMKKGLASQKSRPALLLPTRGQETLLVSWVKVLFHEWPDLVTKLTNNKSYYSRDFFGKMLRGSFVSYRFVFLTCVPGAAYLL